MLIPICIILIVILSVGSLLLWKKAGESGKDMLGRNDADILMGEALDGTGCSMEYRDKKGIDSQNYYIYTVKDSDGNEISSLAVNASSGEVSVYDGKEKKLKDFSEFEYSGQSKAAGSDIDWDGVFVNGGKEVTLLPADESSFEFTFRENGSEGLVGVARAEGAAASYEGEGGTVSFQMGEDGQLQITETGNSGLSGVYRKK